MTAARNLVVLAALAVMGCGTDTVPERSSVAAEMERRLRHHLGQQDRGQVLVNLSVGRESSIATIQRRVLGALEDHFRPTYIYRNVPALAGELRKAGLEQLLAQPEVASVQIDEPGRGHLAQAVPVVQANIVQASYGWTGKGVRVAVLDSGIDTDHPDLMDDLVAQQCFNSCPPGGAAQGPSAEDDHGHGSATSGIITSKGTVSAVGFAPDAEIVAVRVLDSNISGGPSQWVAGLDWVLTNLSTLKVNVVNMSLGTWSVYPGNCDAQQPALASAIQQLVAQGVTVFASSGNKGESTGIDAPACITGVIAVGATYDSAMGRQPPTGSYPPGCFDAAAGPEVIACFTNSGSELDIVAPGVKTTSTNFGGGTVTWSGTSLSSPVAAGVAALLLECNPGFTPLALETALEQSGSKIVDPKNTLSFPSINALTAVNQSCACVGKPDGTACHDGKMCTVDSCQTSVCASVPKACTALDQCHLPGTCNPATGICSNPQKPISTPCDDTNPCTQTDACDAAGACVGVAYTCTPTQCEVSACDGLGGCTPTPKTDGTACDDSDACTQTDGCQAGVCVGGDPVTCPTPTECHEPGTCDPQTGACSDPLSADGTTCTGGGTCTAGICVPPPDIGVPDLSVPDLGMPDQGVSDQGAPDVAVTMEAGVASDLTEPDAGKNPEPSNGCSCEVGQSGGPRAGLALLGLMLLGLVRRRPG